MSLLYSYPIELNDSAVITPVAPDEYPQLLDILELAFPDTSRSFFYAITTRDPYYKPDFTLAVKKDGEWKACVQIFERVLQFADRKARVGGIGSVATHPDSRGRGYSTALMNHALEVMRGVGMQAGMLFTSIHPFYERLGWQTIRQMEQEMDLHQIPVTAAPVAVRPLQPAIFLFSGNLWRCRTGCRDDAAFRTVLAGAWGMDEPHSGDRAGESRCLPIFAEIPPV